MSDSTSKTGSRPYAARAREASADTESKYTFRAYRRGKKMVMKLAVRVPNSPGSTDFHLVDGGKWEEVVSLDQADEVIAAIRRAFGGTLGGRSNPLRKSQ